MIDLLTPEAREAGGRVKAVHIKIGPLAGVIREAFTSAWDSAREDSVFGHARLVIEDVPLVVWCPQCDAARVAESVQHLRCGSCGTPAPQVISGRELDVVAMEISDEPANPPGGSPAENIEAK